MGKRMDWADRCKFVGIFFMVWGHAGVSPGMDSYLHSFHMPVFFFLSGYFLSVSKHRFQDILVSRFKSLIIPYFVFGGGLCLLWNLYYRVADPSKNVPIREVLASLFLFNADSSPFAAVQWFLTSLFFAELIFFALAKLCKENVPLIAILTMALSIIGFCYPVWFSNRLILGIDTALSAAAFLGFGWLLRQAEGFLKKEPPAYLLLFSAAVLLAAGYFTAEANGYVNMRVMLYGNYFLYYGSALLTILGFFQLCRFLAKAPGLFQTHFFRFLLYIGRNTIVVLVLNQAIKTILTLIFDLETVRTGMENGSVLWLNFALGLAVLALSAPAAWLINQFVPFTVGRRFPEKCKNK